MSTSNKMKTGEQVPLIKVTPENPNMLSAPMPKSGSPKIVTLSSKEYIQNPYPIVPAEESY